MHSKRVGLRRVGERGVVRGLVGDDFDATCALAVLGIRATGGEGDAG